MEAGSAFQVRLLSPASAPLVSSSRDGRITFPARAWKRLLKAGMNQPLKMEVFARQGDGKWIAFAAVTNHVTSDTVDPHLAYRFIPSIHHFWSLIAIHDRDVETFRDRCVIDNENFGRDSCINCHSFLNNSPDTMSFQVRSKRFGPPMLAVRNGKVQALDLRTPKYGSPAAYHSWHPGGTLVAFSRNKLSPFEHSVGEAADVWDQDSNLFVYDVAGNALLDVPAIAAPDRRETWPSWSADGRWLYFCSAPQLPFERFQEVRYDLMRVEYRPEDGTWGLPEVLVSSAVTGLSAAHPREAPGGRWLLFAMAVYGNFPIYKPDSDIYMLDLQTRQFSRLEINSDWCDSWHSWSSNGKWIAFASKRGNGLMARVYFSYFDGNGRFSKPFVLPQEDPDYYESCAMTYNLPELVKGPIQPSARALARAICSTERLKPTFPPGEADAKAAQPDPSQGIPWTASPSAR